jgi:hypothetical protein
LRLIISSNVAVHAENHLGLDSGYEKAVIPWGAITSQRADFIEDQFLPPGFEMQRDPSKMNKTQIVQLLQYWYGRQNNRRVSISFQFKAYKDRSTGQIINCDRKGKGKAGKPKTSSKKSGGGRSARRVEEDDEISDTGGEPEPTHDSEPDNITDSDDSLPLAQSKTKGRAKGEDKGKARARDKHRAASKGKNKASTLQDDRISSNPESDSDSNAKSSTRSPTYVRQQEARKRRLQVMREKALERAKKRFLADMEKERLSAEREQESGGGAGSSKGQGTKRKADADDDGARKKAKGKEVKSGSSARKIVTRSRGQAEFEGLAGNLRSRKVKGGF